MEIKSEEELRNILGTPNPVLEKKIYSYLNSRMISFIENSPLMFVATVDQDGFPTISPKGDSPGFVKVNDTNTLLIPERKGNKLAYTFKNILRGSKVAVLFVVPGTNEILRVHGNAVLINDSVINSELKSASHSAILATRLDVANCYFHCGKAFLRSKIFSDELQLKDMGISFGQELSENTAFDGSEAIAFDQGVKSRYKTDL